MFLQKLFTANLYWSHCCAFTHWLSFFECWTQNIDKWSSAGFCMVLVPGLRRSGCLHASLSCTHTTIWHFSLDQMSSFFCFRICLRCCLFPLVSKSHSPLFQWLGHTALVDTKDDHSFSLVWCQTTLHSFCSFSQQTWIRGS